MVPCGTSKYFYNAETVLVKVCDKEMKMFGIHMTDNVNYGGYFEFFGERNNFTPEGSEYKTLEFCRKDIKKLQIDDLPHIFGNIIYIFIKRKGVYKFYVPYGDFFELLLWTYELPLFYRQTQSKKIMNFKSENFED